jgi:hypothetical protein
VCQNENRNASPGGEVLLCAHATPHRRRFSVGIPCRQKQLRLMGSQYFRRFVSRWPPSEPAFRETLGCNPKPLPVVREDSDRFAAAAAKDEQAAGKRIGVELLAAKLGEGVNALPCVDGFDRHQDAQLRRNLNQDADSSSSRLSVARYETDAFFN